MKTSTRAYLFCFLAIFFFSTIELVGKLIGKTVSPVAITAYRFGIGGLILLPLAIRQYHQKAMHLEVIDFLTMAYPGILNVCISMLFLQLGVYYGKASLSAILVATNPLFVAIFGFLILHENLGRQKMLGILMGLIGIVFIISGEQLLHGNSAMIVRGMIFGFLAAITFGLYTVISKKYVMRYGNFLFNSVTFISGSVVLMISGFLLGIPMQVPAHLSTWLYIGYLSLFVTGLAYVLFFEGLKSLPAATGSMFFFLKPVLASLLAVLVIHEHLSGWQVFGIFLIVIALNTEYPLFSFTRKK